MNTVYILWQRQLKRFYRNKARVIGSFAQPLLFLVAFGFGFGPVFQEAGQGSYLQFLVPGIISMSILFSSIFSGIELIWDKQFGFLKETLVAPVSRLKIMIGRVLGGATIAVMQGIIILLISLLFGFKIYSVWFALFSIIVMFVTAILFTAIGTAIASKLTDMQGFQLLMNLLVMPLFFLSGALFPLENLPKAISIITSLNPLTYAVDLIRYLLIGINSFSVIFSIVILIILMSLAVIVSSRLFSRMEV